MSTIKVNSIVPNSGTHVSGAFTGTFSGSIENERLDRLESFSSSLDAAFATDAQLTSLSASLDTRINAATNEQDLSGLATKVELNDFTASYSTDSASFADRLDNTGGGGSTDISALNDFTGSYLTDSASFADRIDAATNEQDLSNLATTGSNSFEGNQNINGDLIITGSTLSIKKSTDSDPLFTVDVNSKRLGLVQGNGELPGEFYLALSGSTAFSPRPDKTMFYGSRGFTFRTTSGIVSEFTNNRTSLTGSLLVSSSFPSRVNFNTYQVKVESNGANYITLSSPNTSFEIYNTNSGGSTGGTWLTSGNTVRHMAPILQLSELNGDPGIVNVIGKLNVTGSMGISGSIIPAIGSSATSSFSLGSATNAWKDIWVSQGTIHFLDGAGVSQGTLSTTANGIQSDGDIYVNSNVRVGKGPGNNDLNTVFGAGALQSNTSGSNNTAFGGSALSNNTTGELNTAIGLSSMAFNSTGYYNTAVGQTSLYSNETGIANTAVGVRAGDSIRTGNNNVIMGYETLHNITNGTGNTAIGYQAGTFASGSSGQNIYLGYQAGPTASITENNKLYIDFYRTDKPLIGGDFQQREVTVNGMLNVTTFLTLPPQNPLPVNPSPTLGSIAVSGSALYFYNGSAWKEVSLVP